MKRYHFKPRLLLVCLFLGSGIHLASQTVTHQQQKKKDFPVTRETTLEIENKYGTILVVPWDKDSARVTVDIFLEARNSSKLRKIRNDIDVSFSATPHYIVARTTIGEGSSQVVSELRALTNSLSSRSSVEINYTVYVPDYIDLVLDNKFGDIYIDDVEGDIDISLSNGALKANEFKGNSTVDLTFAKAMIHKMGNASLSLSYSEMKLGSVNQLDLVSKSSELDIDTAGVLKIDSRRDHLSMGQVDYLYGSGSFTSIGITSFIREADCYLKYGRISVDHVNPSFARINIESDYTDIILNFEGLMGFDVDITHNDKAELTLPKEKMNLETSRVGDELLETRGYYGVKHAEKYLNIEALHKCYIRISATD